jgi:hypothetical protein
MLNPPALFVDHEHTDRSDKKWHTRLMISDSRGLRRYVTQPDRRMA